MPISSPTFKPSGSVTVEGATSSEITNLSLAVADTEYSHNLNDGLKQIIIRNRNNYSTRIAFVSGETATKYFTIPQGCTLTISDLSFSSTILYARSPGISTLEIIELT